MKLYFMPGACSLASHITAREAGIPLDLVRVDGKTKTYEGGADFTQKNPKGYVPTLELDDGEVLTEGPVIAQYLADRTDDGRLAPKAGTLGRYRLQETLGFINSEVHKTYSPLFNPATTPETRADRVAYLQKRYGVLEKQLEGKKYLFGDDFSVADAYLFTVTRWATPLAIDLSAFPNLQAFQQRVGERPAVQEALRAEGIGGK